MGQESVTSAWAQKSGWQGSLVGIKCPSENGKLEIVIYVVLVFWLENLVELGCSQLYSMKIVYLLGGLSETSVLVE